MAKGVKFSTVDVGCAVLLIISWIVMIGWAIYFEVTR